MEDFFYWLLSMSIAAAFTGLVILLLRMIRRIPKRIVVWLWAAPYFRMCIPVSVNTHYSLMRLLNALGARNVPVHAWPADFPYTSLNTIVQAESYAPIVYKTEQLTAVFRIAFFVWAAGAALLLIAGVLRYVADLREAGRAKPLRNNLFVSDTLPAPAVYGIIKPKILLPEAEAATAHIVRHEQTHIRRADNARRLIACLLTAAHWFNPFAWLFLRLYLTDLELACDEQTVARYTEEERKDYAAALLNAARRRTVFPSPFGGTKLRGRIERVLSYRRLTTFSAVCCGLLIAAVLLTLLTNGT